MSDAKSLARAAILGGALLGSSACGGRNLSSSYAFYMNQPTGAAWTPAMRYVILVADNQTQHLYGDPFWMRSELGARAIHTAVRPLQLDLYGQDLLRWVLAYDDLANSGDGLPIIHLGDGLNFSCEVEMNTFFVNMARAAVPWAMAPGNHDGYFFGTEANSTDWGKACENGGRPINHADFVRRYLDVLQKKYGLPSLAGASGRWQRDAPTQGDVGFLDGLAWSLDASHPWRSFVTQLLNVREANSPVPAYVVLLDTSDYDEPPVLLGDGKQVDAGNTGSIRGAQIAAARDLLATRVPAGSAVNQTRPLVVLMGHHPYGVLTPDSRERMDSLMADMSAVTYVSAHTHTAQYFVNPGPKASWLELNLGSVLDWSPEFRQFSLSVNSSANGDARCDEYGRVQAGRDVGEADPEHPLVRGGVGGEARRGPLLPVVSRHARSVPGHRGLRLQPPDAGDSHEDRVERAGALDRALPDHRVGGVARRDVERRRGAGRDRERAEGREAPADGPACSAAPGVRRRARGGGRARRRNEGDEASRLPPSAGAVGQHAHANAGASSGTEPGIFRISKVKLMSLYFYEAQNREIRTCPRAFGATRISHLIWTKDWAGVTINPGDTLATITFEGGAPPISLTAPAGCAGVVGGTNDLDLLSQAMLPSQLLLFLT